MSFQCLKEAIHHARGVSWNEARPVVLITFVKHYTRMFRELGREKIEDYAFHQGEIVCTIRSYAQMP